MTAIEFLLRAVADDARQCDVRLEPPGEIVPMSQRTLYTIAAALLVIAMIGYLVRG